MDWPTDPAAAEIVTEDLARFYEAFDAEGKLARNLRVLYLRPGTDGLHGMVRARIGSARKLARTVENVRPFYAGARETILAFDADPTLRGTLRAAYARAGAELAAPVFPTLTLVVGRLNSGGTVGPAGSYVGAEFFSEDTADESVLDDWSRDGVRPAATLPNTVIHEWVHTQQAGCAGAGSLLAQSLAEGVADFLAARYAPTPVAREYDTWGAAHEAEAWAAFSAARSGVSIQGWLYSGTDDRPADVGYFLGHRIASAWWDAHAEVPIPERTAALLAAHCDAEGFLAASGYAPPAP